MAAMIIILFHGVALKILAFIGLVIVFCWSMCGVYTGLFRRYLLKKYFLKDEEDPDHCLLPLVCFVSAAPRNEGTGRPRHVQPNNYCEATRLSEHKLESKA